MTTPLAFDVFVRDRASGTFNKIGQAASKSAVNIEDLGKKGDAAAKRQTKSWDTIGKASAVAAVGGALALGKMASASITFDKALSGVAAVSNATAGELESLRAAALKAGADTSFSASQAADAEGELARAGVSTADILGGALRGSLDLAAAGQLDLGDAATISAQAMNIFNLSGKDVAHIADVLAAGANKSAADVGQLGDAMKQSGQVAASMGLGLEDTVGVLSLFADNALSGSDAGTSLKTALQKIAAPSAEAAGVMKDLGLNAFDAGGQFVGMSAFAGQLQAKLGGLTQEQRNAALATIFGADAVRAANVLMTAGAKGVDEYTKAVNDQGAAGRVAAIQMDNLAGDLDTLKGSIETTLIKSGSEATGALRGMAKGATGVVNAFGDMPGPVQATAVGMLAVGTAGLGIVAMIGTVVPKIQQGREALVNLGRGGEIANAALGKFGRVLAVGGGVLAGVTALGFALKKLQDAMTDAPAGVEEVTSALLGMTRLSDKIPTLGADMEYLGVQVRRLADPSLGDQAAKTFTNILTLGQADPGKLRDATANLNSLDSALAGLVSSGHTGQATAAFNELARKAAEGGATVDQLKATLPLYRDALAGASNATTIAAGEQKKLGKAADSTKVSMQEEKTAVEQLKEKLDALNGKALDAGEAENRFRTSILDVAAATKENGRSLDFTTAKTATQQRQVIANRETIFTAIRAAQAHSEAVIAQGGTVEDASEVFRQHIAKLRQTALDSGFTKKQVDQLLASYGKTPKAKPTKVDAPGAVVAKRQVDAFVEAANAVPKTKKLDVIVAMHGYDTTAASSAVFGTGGGRRIALAGGGPVPGFSPSPRSDNVPIMATAGEEMIQEPSARKYRRTAPGLLESINRGTFDPGKFFMGGDEGTPVPYYGRLWKFAAGGTIPGVQSFLSRQAGKPYIWGGAGPSGFDCSGYVGAAYGLLTGKGGGRGQRYFTTTTIGAGQGFRRGLGTFSVGVTAGTGHMAGNLGGMKFEATPPRLRVGSAAASVNSFARKFYLPQIGGRFLGEGVQAGPPPVPRQAQLQVLRALRPEVYQALLRSLGVKRDAGGLLLPGQAALNVNGGRERVLNAQQNQEWESGQSRMHPADIRALCEGIGRTVIDGIRANNVAAGRTADLYVRGG